MVSLVTVVICLSERNAMSKEIKGNQCHLTISDRFYIEQELLQKSSFRSIAKVLHKDPSTISKEVLRSSRITKPVIRPLGCYSCASYQGCSVRRCCRMNCSHKCRKCFKVNPTKHCSFFKPFICHATSRPPYVCNGCCRMDICTLEHRIYSSRGAQSDYEKKLKGSREGIALISEELLLDKQIPALPGLQKVSPNLVQLKPVFII